MSDLRDAVFTAARRGPNDPELATLCAQHRDDIADEYPDWKRAGNDPALAVIAQHFASKLGDGRLLQIFMGMADINPVTGTETAIRKAREQLANLQLEEAAAALKRVLEKQPPEHLKRQAAELLSQALFGLGQVEEAARYHSSDDLRRYLNPDQPPVRLLATAAGREYELDELPRELRSHSGFVFRRNRVSLPLAQRHLYVGREAANQNDPVKALENYRKAAAIDRYDPDPRTGAGFLLLQMRRLNEAVELYDEADRLAPGWFRLSTEAWCARELAAGRMLPPAWLAVLQLESGRSSPQETLQFAGPVLKLLPRIAPLHYWHGRALEDLGQDPLPSYRKALELAAEPNLKTRALFALGAFTQDKALLQEAAALQGHLPSATQARWMLDEL